MTEAITHLKNIRDELERLDTSYTGDSFEKAMEVCNIVEHIHLAKHHINTAINKLIIYEFFSKG